MVYINGQEIPSFSEETTDEFRNRVGVAFKTLPSLMSDIKDDKVYFVENLIRETRIKSFGHFLNWLQTTHTFSHTLDIELILYIWILSNKEDDEYIGYKRLQDEIKDSELLRNMLLRFDLSKLEDKDFTTKIKKKIKEKKDELEKSVAKVDKIYKTLYSKKQQPHTDFKKHRYQTFLSTTLKDVSLDYIFSTIVCNSIIPFCAFKNFCKIYKKSSFEFSKNTESLTEAERILLKISIKDDVFVDSFIFLKDGVVKVEIHIDIEQKFDFKKHITELLNLPKPLKFLDIDTEEHDIHGVVLFPQQHLNKYILSDLIMNNPIVSKFVCVDESVKASTKKSGLLLKYKGGELRGIDIDASCNVICKKITETDSDLKGYDRKQFAVGTYYVRVRLSRFKNMDKIDAFILLISKIFTLYHESEKSIIKEYKEFLGDLFDVKDTDVEEQEDTIETLAPSIFVSRYRKACKEVRHPVIVKESERGALEEYKDYIRFPKEEMPEQFCYRCTSAEYPYIGLMPNTLMSNRDVYEYVPCCYANRKNNNNNIDIYYFDKEKETDKKQQGIISTLHHLLERGHYGNLPKNIDTLLSTLYTDKSYLFYRMGVKKSKHSFLECVLKATGEKKHKIRSFEVASQENPDLSLSDMKALFENEDVYMDPRRWIRLLENTYKCNIHIFSRLFKNENADLVIPFHTGSYLQYKPLHDQTIFIIENQDSRTREIRCELITIKEVVAGKEKYMYLFDKNSDVFPTQLYLGEHKTIIHQFDHPPQELKYKYQILDSFKKVQCLVTHDNIYLLCNPLPPLDLPIYDTHKTSLFKSNKKDVEKVLKRPLNKDELKQLQVNLDPFIIYLKSEEDDEDEEEDEDEDEKEDKETTHSEIDTFLANQKISKILGELFIYMFSVYLSLQKDQSVDIIKHIKTFVEKHVSVSLSHYKPISLPFIDFDSLQKSGYVTRRKGINKIIVSLALLKRLVCLLRLCIANNWDKVKTYYLQIEFFNFYEHISDYAPSLSSLNIIIYISDLKKLSPISRIVYSEFQTLEKYYLKFQKKLFRVETAEESIKPGHYNVIYDENLAVLKETSPGTIEKVRLIQYKEKIVSDYKYKINVIKYQKMTLV